MSVSQYVCFKLLQNTNSLQIIHASWQQTDNRLRSDVALLLGLRRKLGYTITAKSDSSEQH